jgi:hypothetical protein
LSDTLRRLEWSPEGLQLAHRDKSQSPEFTVDIDAKRTFVDERSRPNLQRMTPGDIWRSILLWCTTARGVLISTPHLEKDWFMKRHEFITLWGDTCG